MQQAMQELCDKILAHRHEPMALMELWAQHMMIIRRARELHIKDGDFHPDSHIAAGGGVKGVALPADYKEQVDRFYGNVRRGTGYGMTEQAQVMPRCEKLRYHVPPGLIMLLLDQPGEKLIAREPGSGGVVEGRYAFLIYFMKVAGADSSRETALKWTCRRCPCGPYGPTIWIPSCAIRRLVQMITLVAPAPSMLTYEERWRRECGRGQQLAALLEQREGAVVTLTMSNPGKLNAMSARLRDALTAAFARLNADPQCRAIILTGAEREFSAGADMAGWNESTVQECRTRLKRGGSQLVREMVAGSKPIIAAVEGHAFGAGLALVCAADHVVASRAASFCCAFTRVGFIPDMGLMFTLPNRCGCYPRQAAHRAGGSHRQRACRAHRAHR